MKNKRLIYIGNQLKKWGGNPTSIDVLAPQLEKEDFEVICASAFRNKILRALHMLSVILKNSRSADWILIDTYSTQNFWYAYFCGKLAHLLKKKYVLLLHGGDLPKRLQTTPAKTRWLLKKSHVNIAPSVYLQKRLQEEGLSEIKYIPNSISLKNYEFRERKDVQPKLLWVRAFANIYDPMSAIKTLELLFEKYEQAELCMVGPEKDETFKKCQAYVEEKALPVSFPGKLDKSRWHQLSQEYDIFLNTSTVDNTPVSVIEAMALGLPVVSTNVGGIPYLITDGHHGVLVPPNDPAAMANAVEELLSHPEKTHDRAISAREKVEEFDWDIVKKQWVELLS